MDQAAFFRNVSDYKMLCNYTSEFSGMSAKYYVIATIELNAQEFESFCHDFRHSYDYLEPYIEKAVIQHDIWRCILVVHEDQKILVVMNHYQYPRYLAILQ